MSSHDCLISGVIVLKPEIDLVLFHRAMQPFCEWLGTSISELMKNNYLSFDGQTLALDIPFQGSNGFENANLDEIVESLSTLSRGPNWIEVFDYDAGDTSTICIPRFIGTPDERKEAQVLYGLETFAEWAEPILGKDVLANINASVLAQIPGR